MANSPLQLPLTATPRAEQMFPVFSDAQLTRISSHGRRREMRDGEVLIEAGDQRPRIFVVARGEVEITGQLQGHDMLIAVLQRGQFSGELNILSGRRGM